MICESGEEYSSDGDGTSEDFSVEIKVAKPSNASINKHIGARVAKNFDEGLFFGTITKYDDKADFWFVEYDDGDSEQYDKNDLDAALRLYKKNANKVKKNQPKQGKGKASGKRAASGSNNKVKKDVMTPVEKKRKVASTRIGARRSPRCVAGLY